MRFTLSSTTLGSRLADMSKVLSSKSTLSILTSFLFEVKDQYLTITASDSENVMMTTIELTDHDGEGSFCIGSTLILNAIKELPEQPIAFTVDMETLELEIAYQNGHFNFMASSADQYPVFHGIEGDSATISMPAATLSENINRTFFATTKEDNRPVMSGILFDLTPDYLAMVATDGHKLVRCRNMSIKSNEPSSFILPQKPAQLLKNMLTKDAGEVIIRYNDQNAEITFDTGTLICRLIEGRYPNYNSVIPNDNPCQLSIDREAFLSATKRVLIASSLSNLLVRLHVENGLLRLNADDADFAKKAEESIICEYTGPTMEIGFKGATLVEILSAITSEQIFLQFADPSRPGIIVPAEQEADEDLLMLIMPMLLND